MENICVVGSKVVSSSYTNHYAISTCSATATTTTATTITIFHSLSFYYGKNCSINEGCTCDTFSAIFSAIWHVCLLSMASDSRRMRRKSFLVLASIRAV